MKAYCLHTHTHTHTHTKTYLYALLHTLNTAQDLCLVKDQHISRNMFCVHHFLRLTSLSLSLPLSLVVHAEYLHTIIPNDYIPYFHPMKSSPYIHPRSVGGYCGTRTKFLSLLPVILLSSPDCLKNSVLVASQNDRNLWLKYV